MNGSVIGSQTTFPNKLEFSCDEGFDLIGSTARKCEADGVWSGEQPSCRGKTYLEFYRHYFKNDCYSLTL